MPGEEVLDHSGGPLLVLGGPGTGKSRILERRFLHLAGEGSVSPHRILLLCTNRSYAAAAQERLARALPQQATLEIPVLTWHGLAYHLVTRFYPLLGFKQLPVLLTGPEQWATVRELLDGEDPARWPLWQDRLPERTFADEVADFCLRVEQQLITDQELQTLAAARPSWAEVIAFAQTYRRHLWSRARLDYAQLISSAVTLLDSSSGVAAALKKRFHHVMVDDGQDMGRAHRRLLQLLNPADLVVAADPDSGIETYRGAEPDWVFGFEKWFGPARTVVLDRGQRIGSPLAPALLRLIGHNETSLHRPRLEPDHSTQFECRQYSCVADEVESIAREIRRLHMSEGIPWSQMAVLLSQPRVLLGPLQRSLEVCGIPFKPMEGSRLVAAEPAVKYFLDLSTVCLQGGAGTAGAPGATGGPGTSLSEVLTGPLAGLDFSGRRRLEREAWRSGRSLQDVVAASPEGAELRRLSELIVRHQERADECFWQVYSTAPYYRELERRALGDPDDPANAALDALVAFSHALERFVERRGGSGSMGEYLNEAARAEFGADPWMAPASASARGVSITSFHGAKGREWEVVMVAGCLDAWIPKGRRAQGLFDPLALQSAEAASREMEAIAQDRRTFYVAATRARSRVIFTVAPANGSRARPSRFLFELSGCAPAQQSTGELPAATTGELAARLRRSLLDVDAPPPCRVAAVISLSEIPGTNPDHWYGRPDWTGGVTPVVEGELRSSYSRLSVFENCGLQYVLQSVLGLDPASTHSMKFGTWMHALFQAAHQGRICDPDTLRAQYHKLFDETVFPNATIARQFRRDGLKMLEVFWRFEYACGPNVLAERGFEFPFAGAVLRGRIDRIDKKNKGRAVVLTDYKTARWAPSYTEAQSSLQLAIYHLAARMDQELMELGEPQLARLVYPGAYGPDGSHRVLSQNAEQADQVIEKLPRMISDVLREDFRPSPQADCHFCKMRLMCPLYPEGSEVGQ